MQLTVALAAEEAAGAQALKLAAARGHRVVAVFSDSEAGTMGGAVAEAAAKLDVPVRPAGQVRDPGLADDLRAAGVDLVLNVHSLHIVDAEVLVAPPLGAYNLHPGPLPERAGLNAPGWALYEGAEAHGVTLHRMTPGVDEGPIAFIERFEVGPSDTALQVMTQCIRRGLPLLEQLLQRAESGEAIPAHAQDLSDRRWFGAGPPEGGRLSWDRPARAVTDFVRACDYRPFPSPWSFPRCLTAEREIAIAAAKATTEATDAPAGTVAAGDGDGDGVLVAADDNWVRVEWVEVSGERTAAAEVLRQGDLLSAGRDVARSPKR